MCLGKAGETSFGFENKGSLHDGLKGQQLFVATVRTHWLLTVAGTSSSARWKVFKHKRHSALFFAAEVRGGWQRYAV